MTNLQRRLKKLEARSDPRGPLRLVVRYPEEETESDFDENDPNTVLVVVDIGCVNPSTAMGDGPDAGAAAERRCGYTVFMASGLPGAVRR